jgi:peptidoglycan-N-acetylglucosamine deacetylase
MGRVLELGVYIVAGACGMAAVYIGLPTAAKILLRRRFLDRIANSDCVCLTFDDGPNPDATPQVLGMLKAAGAQATFFVIGEFAMRYPHILDEVTEAGHQVGEHGYSHYHAWKAGPVRSLREMARGRKAVLPWVRNRATRTLPYRPPYGKLNLMTLLCGLFAGREFIFWNVDPRDYRNISSERLAEYVEEHMGPGSVILLHDGPETTNANVQAMLRGLETILAVAKARGLRLTTIETALKEADARRH